ncbi:hypothetical protein Tco_1487762, partial [Tanacetum coccineum]
MPIENNKPPDPILEEFSTLTGMSSEGLSHKPFVPHDVSVLYRSSRLKSCSDVSPLEDNHGKCPNSCVAPVDEVFNKVYGSKSNVPSYCSINGNDGSFICKPCAPSVVVVEDCNRVSKDKGSGLDVCVDPFLVSNDTSKLNMADEEHGEGESIRKANKDG